jgi:hypothetical protein
VRGVKPKILERQLDRIRMFLFDVVVFVVMVVAVFLLLLMMVMMIVWWYLFLLKKHLYSIISI